MKLNSNIKKTRKVRQAPIRTDPAKAMQRAGAAESMADYARAAEEFEQAGMAADALRNWRTSGRFKRARRLAAGKARADLNWMLQTEALMRHRPNGTQDRLTLAERRRLAAAMRLPRPKKGLFD